MRTAWWALPAALLVSLTNAAAAAPIQQGSNILAIQLAEGDVDLVDQATSGGYLTSANFVTHRDVGVQLQFWHFLREDYAFNVSGGIGFFSEKDQSKVAGNPDFKYTQSSFLLRAGGDRVAHVTPRFHIFAGPGIQFWSGKWKEEGGLLTASAESPRSNRLAVDGRIAVHLKCGESFGIFGQLGHYIGYAWASDGDAKTHWWASGHNGAGGLAFNF